MNDRSRLIEETHERAGMRLIRRAISGRWDIPDVMLDQLPRQVVNLLVNARNDREKLRAAEVLVAMNRDNIAALAQADKIERLDSGGATERIESINSISDEQLKAAAKVIAGRKSEEAEPRKPKARRK